MSPDGTEYRGTALAVIVAALAVWWLANLGSLATALHAVRL